jgi:hypothetical protein
MIVPLLNRWSDQLAVIGVIGCREALVDISTQFEQLDG